MKRRGLSGVNQSQAAKRHDSCTATRDPLSSMKIGAISLEDSPRLSTLSLSLEILSLLNDL